MIDLMNNGLNGTNGKSDHVPCPFCAKLSVIEDILKNVATFDGQDSLSTLSILISELRMWRTKEDYQNKLHDAMKQSIIKKLQDNGFQVDGEIS